MAGACSAAAVPGPRGRTTSRRAAASRRAGGRTPRDRRRCSAGEVARASIRAMEAAISRSAALTIARATVSAPSSIDRCSSAGPVERQPAREGQASRDAQGGQRQEPCPHPYDRRGLRVRLSLGRRDLVHGRRLPSAMAELPSASPPHHRRQAKARAQPSIRIERSREIRLSRGSRASGLPRMPATATPGPPSVFWPMPRGRREVLRAWFALSGSDCLSP